MLKIKQSLITLLLMVGMIFLVASCEDKKEDEQHELVGTWDWTKTMTYFGSLSAPDSTEEETPVAGVYELSGEFWDDNTYAITATISGSPQTETGTWSVSGNTITWDNDPTDIDEYSISGNKLTMTSQSTVNSYTIWYVSEWTKK